VDVFDAVKARASVRRLEPANVRDEELEKTLHAGQRAPCQATRKPLRDLVHYVRFRSRRWARRGRFRPRPLQILRRIARIGTVSGRVCSRHLSFPRS
jgi:hypothetical protein